MQERRQTAIAPTETSTKEQYQCYTCSAVFESTGELKEHTKVHGTGTSHYSCPTCGRRFESLADFSAHAQQHEAS